MRGTVVRMIRDRGFGFVRCEDGSEVFFHHSSLPRGVFDTIQDGQEMELISKPTRAVAASGRRTSS